MGTSYFLLFFSSRRRHTRSTRDWSSDVCSSDLAAFGDPDILLARLCLQQLERPPGNLIVCVRVGELRLADQQVACRDCSQFEQLCAPIVDLAGLVEGSLGRCELATSALDVRGERAGRDLLQLCRRILQGGEGFLLL